MSLCLSLNVMMANKQSNLRKDVNVYAYVNAKSSPSLHVTMISAEIQL